MLVTLTIGEWVEPESRDITHCPSSYAADTETLRTTPGRYPLRVTFETGYTHPMPYWVLVKIDATRIAGRLYSGFAGNNFASTELPKVAAPFHVQMNASALADLVANGRVIIRPEFAGLASDYLAWGRAHSWAALTELSWNEVP